MAAPDPANASISRRTYFYPLPYPVPKNTPIPYTFGLPSTNPLKFPPAPVEPTHTLVLTSARKQFVDIRIFRPTQAGQPELPNEGGPRERYVGENTSAHAGQASSATGAGVDVQHHMTPYPPMAMPLGKLPSQKPDAMNRLDWAFAGSSYSEPIDDPFPRGVVEDPDVAHQYPEQHRHWDGQVTKAEWVHWLDSRYPIPTHLTPTHYSSRVPPDEGIMFPVNSCQSLEFGHGMNPFNGKPWAYEELWTDLPIEATPKVGDPDPPKWSVVLRLDAPEHAVRGLVVRVGRFCQGVVMRGGYVSLERWEWVAGGKACLAVKEEKKKVDEKQEKKVEEKQEEEKKDEKKDEKDENKNENENENQEEKKKKKKKKNKKGKGKGKAKAEEEKAKAEEEKAKAEEEGKKEGKAKGKAKEKQEDKKEEKKVEVGDWKRTARIGDQFLPCAVAFHPEILTEGGTVKYWDYEWVCEEKVAWRDTEM